MADNVDITAGSGTTIATDQIGTAHFQRIKLVDGIDGSNNPLIVGSLGAYVEVKSMPITTVVNGSAGFTQPVSGTFWQTTQPVSGTFWQATQPVSLTTVPIHPIVNGSAGFTQPVSGTFWQTQQPIVNGSAGFRQPMTPYEVSSNLLSGVINNWNQLAGASPQLVIPAPGVGVSFHLTNFTIVNSNGSLGSSVALQNVNGSPLFRGYAGPNGGGLASTFPAPIPTAAVNQAVYLALGTASANFYGTVSGYKA